MDDQETILNVVSDILRCLGYDVQLARDGAEAIELYKETLDNGDRFDAVLIDLTIPTGMGGAEAITKLRQIDPKIKAIVCSGYLADPIMLSYENYGFRAAIGKPYSAAKLAQTISEVIQESNQ